MASSSSSLSRKHEVFLSFRGEDTRNTFVSHLYAAFKQKGIETYMDEHNLEKGQSITSELLKSIEESKFAIIIFSKNYASSTWCLDELVKIMECRYKCNQVVIPIFYDVGPSDVRKQNNSFAESFIKHEVHFKDNMEKVQIWKECLTKVASIAGHDLSQRNVPEASCINKIVDTIFSELPRKASITGLVGMENHLKKLNSLMVDEPNAVCFVGIWGMGGIGKTTIARFIFDKLLSKFEGGCFLHDVYKHDMVDLQRNLISGTLKSQIYIHDEYEGSILIRKCLCYKRVLLVLDDVNDIKQLDSLAGGREWFGNGSRIIVTTRDKHLLNDVNKLYEIKTLSNNEAIQLFSWHAFKRSHPVENFVELSYRVLRYAGGLPLALKVLGSYLSGRQKDVWESTLNRLQNDPEKKIDVPLKISFDGLNDTQQNIFLDIACFFRGHHKDFRWNYNDNVIKKLDSFGFHPAEGIEVLKDKSLIYISDERVQMHDLIQEMGQNIVRQRADKDPGKYSRLWDAKHINDVLTNDTGTDKVEGLVLRQAHNIDLSEEVFRNMNRLRLLELRHEVNLVISLNYLPNSLRWLCWNHYPAKSLPQNFKPRNLVSLDLSYSPTLQTSPDTSDMPNLEILRLWRCEELLEVHPSVGVHKKLVHLDLSCCYKIQKIPRTMQMKYLETLSLCGSSELQSLPQFHSNMISLRTLHLENIGIRELPLSFGRLTNLQEIELVSCKNLKSLPNSLYGLKNLESIKLYWCSNLNENDEYTSKMLTVFLSLPSLQTLHMLGCNVSEMILPESIDCLHSLQNLDLSGNNFVSLPDIKCFSCLQNLRLWNCSNLEALPELPAKLKNLNMQGCTALTIIPNLVDLLNKYKTLQLLSLVNCKQLVQKEDTLGQSVPQFLLSLLDWGSTTNIFRNRQEIMQINLPCNDLVDWLHKSTGPQATVIISSSWHNYDNLRGFVICAISRSGGFKVVSSDGLVTMIPTAFFHNTSEHTVIFYIPISKINRGIDRNEKKDYCLLEVSNGLHPHKDLETTWGIGLVYDTAVDNMHASDLIDTYGPMNINQCATLKVCVTTRSRYSEINLV